MNSERNYDEEMEHRYQRFRRESRIPDDFKYCYSGSSSSDSDFEYSSRREAIDSKNKVEMSRDNMENENQKECEEKAQVISEEKAPVPAVIVNQPITRSGYLATPEYQCNFVRCSRKFMSRGSLNKHLKLHAGLHYRI